ncbi:MAG: PP2C family protein-serine/threonine phosphatase [Planctomycetota bacterium]|jgi:PAS domain S-box-containing protein
MKTGIDHYREATNMDNVEIWRLLKERALDSTAEGVVISDCNQPDMPIIYVNNAFTAMTGYSWDEVVGKNCRFLQGSGSDPETSQEIRKAISEQRPCKVEILNYRKDGTQFWNRLSITPVRDDQGRATHFIGIQTDITRRREAEDALRSANAQLKRDLQAAAQVQQSQLPKQLPEMDTYRFAWRFKPCQELAGDTLNISALDDHRIAMYVLDVSGHGVQAALQSFSLSQDLRPRDGGPDLGAPSQLLERLNMKYPMNMDTGMYFTILYGVLDVLSGDFTFAAAGHPGPVLIRCNGQPEMIAASAYPVGVSPKPDYQDQTLKLAPGDKLILYTDGVVEALSSRDITFGEGRFLKALSKTADKPIEECLDKVMKSLESWACHVNLRDDLSLVGIEAYM